MDLRNQRIEPPADGIVIGCSDSGQSLYLYFEDFGDQTGRFEIFWTLNEAAAFLRECGLEIPALDADPAPATAPAPRRRMAPPAAGNGVGTTWRRSLRPAAASRTGARPEARYGAAAFSR